MSDQAPDRNNSIRTKLTVYFIHAINTLHDVITSPDVHWAQAVVSGETGAVHVATNIPQLLLTADLVFPIQAVRTTVATLAVPETAAGVVTTILHPQVTRTYN